MSNKATLTTLARSLLNDVHDSQWAKQKFAGMRNIPRTVTANVWEDDVAEKTNDPRVKARLVYQEYDIDKTTTGIYPEKAR